MTAPILGRLRSADPCPSAVAYADPVAQSNIDAIVRTDLTVRPIAPARPRRRRRALLAVAAVGVLLAVAGSVVGVEISRDRVSTPPADDAWVTFSSGGVAFEHPTAWTSYPPGPASTMSLTVAYLSTAPFGPVCTTTTDGVSASMECHGPQPDLSAGGVLVDWNNGAALGPIGRSLDRYAGVATTIDGVDARVDRSTLPVECEATHAVAGVRAAITSPSNGVLTMTACIGPGDVEANLAAVDRMLASVRIER